MGIIISSDIGFTAPLPDTPTTPLPNPIVTSDTFSGADVANINGRTADALLGGAPRAWASTGGVRIVGNHLAAPSTAGTGIALVPHTFADQQIALKVLSLPAGSGILTLMLRAATTATDTSNTAYRAQVNSSGAVSIVRRSGGANNTIASNVTTITAGASVVWRVVGSTLVLLIGGVVVWSGTDAVITSGGYIGLSTSSDSAWTADDVVVRSIDSPHLL